jgi:hypothetical protein
MKYLVFVIVLASACKDEALEKNGKCADEEVESAESKASKLECRNVLKHIVSISPEVQGQDAEQVTAALPYEDIDACVASEPEIRTCMMTAADIPAVRVCIPANDVLSCMQSASKLKAAAHEKAKKTDPDPVIDKPFDDIRAKAWADRSAKPCEALKKLETTI